VCAPNLPTPKASTDSKPSIGTYRIPTWTTPLIVLLFVTALFPLAPFLAHVCSLSVGYMCKCFRPTSASFQSTPSLKISKSNTFPQSHTDLYDRRSRLPQNPRPARKSPSLARRKAQPPRASAALRLHRPKDLRAIRRSAYDECAGGVRGRRGFGADNVPGQYTEVGALIKRGYCRSRVYRSFKKIWKISAEQVLGKYLIGNHCQYFKWECEICRCYS